MTLTLYNTLTRKKDIFIPTDPNRVRMYVCGPTVYGRAHLGNARSVVVYDVLYRLLRHIYGDDHVQYVRNITDVDDKINAAAIELGITIGALTQEVTGWFHDDMKALNVLPASGETMIEPKATEHIAQMVAMIQQLIANEHAYVTADGHVLFAVKSMPGYGKLSGRVQTELEAGARVKVEAYKKDPNDFVLWKPADAEDDASSVFDSPWGKGRPGWHIECSAMSTHYLGADFDIHGGGSDLMFPHHENEIAQSCGANPGSHFARYWVHNGFLTVNGEKMSKSVGNFVTVKDLLDKGVKGEVIRLALLSAKYNEPLDWNAKLVQDAKLTLDKWYRRLGQPGGELPAELPETVMTAFYDDLNIPGFVAAMHEASGLELKAMANLLGLLQQDPQAWFKGGEDDSAILTQIASRNEAKKAKNWAEADRIRGELKSQGILLEDKPGGATDWRRE